jgi:hypothetical protein
VFPEDSAQSTSLKIQFPFSRPDEVSYRPNAQLSKASTVQTTCHTVRTHIRLKHRPSGRRGFLSGPSSMSRSFELLQLASVRTIQQPVQTTLSVRSSFRISFQNTDMGRSLNRPNDADSCLDALIHKASIAIQIQMFGCQSSWSGCASIRYGNCVHQISHPDDHPPGLDAQSLYMEVICRERATVRTTGQHRPDAALKQERFSA